MRTSRFYSIALIIAFSTFCTVACSWNYFEKDPYIQNIGKDHVTIMWETSYSTKSRVDYGITQACNLFVEEEKEVKLHEITLRPLRPSTKYFYEISYGFTTRTGSFKTLPIHNMPFKFAAYGDSRSRPYWHKQIVEKMKKENPDLILHMGDIVGNGKKYSQWGPQFFEPLEGLINHVPIYPCLGNHEKDAQNYFDFFSLPNNESWYSFNYSNCHFVALDTNKNYGKVSRQYKWLVNDLKRTHTKWKIVFLHHPAYSSGIGHGSELEVRRILTPLFRKYGVDIVFCGHEHIYERSFPIGSAFESKNNNPVTYVITGGGGAELHKIGSDIWTASTKRIYNFCVVEIDGGELHFKAIDIDGKIFDKFSIIKEKDKYHQYVKNSIPYEQIEFERKFPDNIESPIVFLDKNKKLLHGSIKINNPLPSPLDVKIVWHHLRDWNLTPKKTSVRIGKKKTERIPFTFYSPNLNKIWPTPQFSVIYDSGLSSGRVNDNHLRIILPKTLSCKQTDIPIDVDGRLEEKFWSTAEAADDFIKSDSSDLAEKKSTAKIIRSKEALYLAFVCNELYGKNLSPDAKNRDEDIENDESVIVSIAPHVFNKSSYSKWDKTIYRFGVNCKGVQFDAKGIQKNWNAKWESASRINYENWTVEMSIPYTVLELSSFPKKGERWKINFFRSTKNPIEKSEWVNSLSSPLSFERMGFLTMN